MLFTFGVVEISCQELPVSLLLSSTIVNLLNFSQKQAFFAIFAYFKPPWKVLKASPGLSIARSLTAGLIDTNSPRTSFFTIITLQNCHLFSQKLRFLRFLLFLHNFEPLWQVLKPLINHLMDDEPSPCHSLLD